MKKYNFLFYFLTAVCFFACTEDTHNSKKISDKVTLSRHQDLFSKVDSVILIGFIDSPRIISDNPEKKYPQLIVNGRLNDSLITRKKRIDNYDELNSIFNDSVDNTEEINLARCFSSDRAIIYYQKAVPYFIKISFQCKRFELSDTTFLNFIQLHDSAYLQLDKYFKSQGF